MNPREFLKSVWSIHCQPGDFVCLSTNKPWREYSFPYDSGLDNNLDEWLEQNAGKDLYFCPLPFRVPRRDKNEVARSKLLWSDIDEGDHSRCDPSILWESSPGRFQGLWVLPQVVTPEEAAQSSKQIAYYMGGDRGGWDLTQVLRIPGTPNLKYSNKPIVKLLRFTQKVLHKVPQSPLDKWRSSIPRKLSRIIEGKAEQGKRSDMLWYLEHELCDLGIPIDDVFSILRDSNWNKYRGRSDEDDRFSSEMEKIREDRGEKQSPTRVEAVDFKVVSYQELMSSWVDQPGWLIEDFWLRNSHGIIAGEPKAFKSTLCTDMLFSVATGTSFLGIHKVHTVGPVLIIQNENADWIMKDRIGRLAASRGWAGGITWSGNVAQITWPRDVPMYFVNQQSFMLDDAANKQALEDLIARLRPVAITLDPLYLMFSGDVNSAKDLGPVLQWCLYIKQKYGCSVVLIHHYGKGTSEKRGGQRMLGSTTLHGWIESAWYLQVQDTPGVITLEREFRGAGVYPKVDITIDQGTKDRPDYKTTQAEHVGVKEEDYQEAVLDLITAGRDLLSRTDIAKGLKISDQKARGVIERMMSEGLIIRNGERYDKAR